MPARRGRRRPEDRTLRVRGGATGARAATSGWQQIDAGSGRPAESGGAVRSKNAPRVGARRFAQMRYRPMLAQKITHVPTGSEWLIEPKYDGWRALAHVDESVRLQTRTGNPISQVPYIAAALAAIAPPGTVLDGEIVDLAGAREWNRTQTILSTTRGGYRHEPTADDPALTYVLFDVLAHAGEDLRDRRLVERKQHLVELLGQTGKRCDDVLRPVPVRLASEQALQEILAAGFEGAVIKHAQSRYVCGARGGGAWYKLKPDAEIEALCTGFYPAEPGSKYAPLDQNGTPRPWAVGGLCFRITHADGRIYDGRAAGMTDELRRDMHEHPDAYIGRVVEITHRGVQDSGALRHPQLKRLRAPHDKPAAMLPGFETQAVEAKASKRKSAPPAAGKRAGIGIATGGKRRMRNYRAMRDPKLRACMESLSAGRGDAYERCLQAGSGDPAADLAEVERLARERGWH